jgi:hypothetical protein
MPTAVEEVRVGRKRAEPESGKPKTTTKVYMELLRRARIVAIHREIDLFDYLDGILRPVIDRDYDKMIREEGADD